MLVLTRRPGEMIRLYTSDGVIEIYLNDCNQNQAKIGFVAPDEVEIIRAEVDEQYIPTD
jgi:carbon storage regulator